MLAQHSGANRRARRTFTLALGWPFGSLILQGVADHVSFLSAPQPVPAVSPVSSSLRVQSREPMPTHTCSAWLCDWMVPAASGWQTGADSLLVVDRLGTFTAAPARSNPRATQYHVPWLLVDTRSDGRGVGRARRTGAVLLVAVVGPADVGSESVVGFAAHQGRAAANGPVVACGKIIEAFCFEHLSFFLNTVFNAPLVGQRHAQGEEHGRAGGGR